MQRCRCGSRRRARRCCARYHQGRTPAPTPEALMRSRFSAYAGSLADYILSTTHPDGPHWRMDRQGWREDVLRFSRETRFLGLEILSAPPADDNEGWVSFHARLTRAGQDVSFRERSRFLRKGDRWLYHSGEPVPDDQI